MPNLNNTKVSQKKKKKFIIKILNFKKKIFYFLKKNNVLNPSGLPSPLINLVRREERGEPSKELKMFSDKRLLDKIEDYRICCLTIWTDDISILGLEALY